tara:strand:- start:331 stop:651 length:321 start_codon:yes stop_codon:yes gene_type:complete
MVWIEGLLIVGFTVTIAIQLLTLRSTHALLLQLLEELDGRLAEAIQAVISDLPLGDLPEPPSPLAQFLLGLLQDQMGNRGSALSSELPRDLKGQFANVIEVSTDQS